jgi:hypothetical protein
MADMQHSNVAAVGSDMSDSDVELVKQRWTREQLELSEKVVQADAESVAKPEVMNRIFNSSNSYVYPGYHPVRRPGRKLYS